MHITDAEEVISRFIGMFGMLDFDPRLRLAVHETAPSPAAVDPYPIHALAQGGLSTPFNPRLYDPQIRYGNDRLAIDDTPVRPLRPAEAAFGLHPPHPYDAPHVAPHRTDFATPDHADPRPADRFQGDPTFAYRDAPSDSLLAETRQVNILDDRDTLSLDADARPLDAVMAVTREFARMVEVAEAAKALPAPQSDPAGMRDTLTAAADHAAPPATALLDPGPTWSIAASAVHHETIPGLATGAPAELQGIFVDGAQSAAAPDFAALLASLRAAPSAEAAGSTLDTGSNTLANDALVRNVGELGAVSTVMGNWYETNAIRQINIHADSDGFEGFAPARFATGGSRTMNVAEFNRIDATPASPASLNATGFFPSHYQVDVIDGDLQISNFLSQLNLTMDGDRVVLAASERSASISTGGNEVAGNSDFLKTLGSYDLVVVGGSVYEGNFIQQINVLSDSDRLVAQMAGPDADGISGSTGGNLLLNVASITNVGGLSDVMPLTAQMSKLVASIHARSDGGDLDAGSDLGFLLSANIRVLYLTGSVYEMNVVSQMNILDDADTVLAVGGPAARFLEAAGSDATWTISTGKNALVNAATIVDVDDVAVRRFTDGHHYSDSMLVQADIVSRGDIETFDVGKLAPELVAFMHDDHGAHDAHDGDPRGFHHHDAAADGVGGILS